MALIYPVIFQQVLAPVQSFIKIILLKLFSLNPTLIKNIVPSDFSKLIYTVVKNAALN